MGGLKNNIVDHYDKNNFAYAFGFYELGNINASIVGGGGYSGFANDITYIYSNNNSFAQQCGELFSQYPDITSALGITSVVVVAPVVRKGCEKFNSNALLNAVDISSSALALGVLSYTFVQDASFITQSASSFVVGSSLMHFSKDNPVLMKPAGLCFALGGGLLAAFGCVEATQLYNSPELLNSFADVTSTSIDKVADIGAAALPALTVISGAYICQTGFLTYGGGAYETDCYKSRHDEDKGVKTIANRLFSPHNGLVSKFFEVAMDRPINALNKGIKAVSLRYIPKDIREEKPFKTIMYARLPWRFLAAGADIAASITGGGSGGGLAASYMSWAAGDHATGREDNNIEKRAALDHGDNSEIDYPDPK